ncbi:DNA-directed RNA polymerase, mitochondrial [Protopterus annectens]|uniref:DNA-directed RNA polymerase, mitochondrial n=1 Tax=Protopterus annectens TaxID=7888 RepID=UPI001CFB63C2|nr:DNA-directed RNA polymerase, mitochondrial [Protopterus annectens]
MSMLRFSSLCYSLRGLPLTVNPIVSVTRCPCCLTLVEVSATGRTGKWLVLKRNYSSIIPQKKTEEEQKCEAARLLKVLEARKWQLLTEALEPEPFSAKHDSRAALTERERGMEPRVFTSDKTVGDKRPGVPNIPKLATDKNVSKSTSPASRWMEKLKKETSITHKRQMKAAHKSKSWSSDNRDSNRMTGNFPKDFRWADAETDLAGNSRQSTDSPKIEKIPNKKAANHFKMDMKTERTVRPLAAVQHSVYSSSRTNSSKSGQAAETTDVEFEECSDETTCAKGAEVDKQLNQWHPTETMKVLADVDSQLNDMQLSILAYLEACLYIEDVDRAQDCLMFYHHNVNRRKLLNIKIYNTLMHFWSKKRDSLKQISNLFFLVEEAGLKPNLNSYAAALECMGRTDAVSQQVVKRCLQQLKEDGFRVDALFQQCIFREDEREMVLAAIQKVHTDYHPPSMLTCEPCTSPLVKEFYTKRKSVMNPKMDFELRELLKNFNRQLEIEQEGTVTINSVEADKIPTPHIIKMRKILQELRSKWQKVLLRVFREYKFSMGNMNQHSGKISLYPYFSLLPDREYIEIMLQSLTSIPPNGESLLVMAREIGTKINNKYCIRKKVKTQMVNKIMTIYSSYAKLLTDSIELNNFLPREYWTNLEAEMSSGPSLINEDSPWPSVLVVHLGTHLLDLMVKELKVPCNILNPEMEEKRIPVLYHMYTFRCNQQVGFIKPHPILTQILAEAVEPTLTFDVYVMPMLCPPVPWTSPHFGGYILSPAKLMRSVEGAIQHQLLLENCRSSDLYAVLDALNQLGNCAWKINQPVLDIIVSIFNDKGNESLDIPPPLSEAPEIPKFSPKQNYSLLDKSQLKRAITQCRKKTAEMHSLRMDTLYKLSIANHMRDSIFWFPHNMDFRGRTYPCPPHFNHLGNDVTRAMLLFAIGKPLGKHGLNWLKIHLVNLTGLKKRHSLKQRLEYANEIIDDILDSADNPLTGRKWWMNSDEPWQTLACCMEIANALRSPDPAKCVSYFPVHQDGSCNGLQHYAALGRDVIGAKSVNLMPSELPQDVYSGVAMQVEEFRKQDAERGVKIAQVLDGFICRKVVKQTVMTVVYGVTRFGGRLQIEKRLREIDNFPKEYVWDASKYLVQQVFSSLKEMFTGTREIQDWLTESARLIAKSGRTVEWLTPLGLPVIQPYHRIRRTSLKSTMQHLSLQVTHDVSMKPDTVKQKNAFPPNFIHSLDSTHMMLTVLHCCRAGLTFASVHDCFWTHAITVDTMNKICREQFVALHNQPVLQNLSKFMVQKYSPDLPPHPKSKKFMEFQRMLELFSKVPQTGEFDLEKVKESTYFFS